jgi:cobyrinic acid a,c-diamide synthase
MADNFSACCIAGTSSGDGKTTVTLALLRALYNRGLKVQPFKCGPDYIDPTFHYKASENRSRNLDCWMMGVNAVKDSFAHGSMGMDVSVIEGVMGLYDASQPGSLSGSTAEVAINVDVPIILTVNVKGMAGSIAAMVKGYCDFCSGVKIIGVIANRVGSANHASLLREALELAELPPLLGYLIRNDKFSLPERHLGLVPFIENKKSTEWFDMLANEAEKCFDIDEIIRLSNHQILSFAAPQVLEKKIKLGIAYDQAFHFYYEDNLDILRDCGFELVEFSPLNDQKIPDSIQAIYLGGGFPEVFAAQLEQNISMRQSIKEFACTGGTIYAECGGFMYLTDALKDINRQEYRMCGVIPAMADMGQRLRSLGYREVNSCNHSFLGPPGTILRGHEFHWSTTKFTKEPIPAWRMLSTRKDAKLTATGYQAKNIMASYIHLHFASNINAIKNWYNKLNEKISSV